SSCRAPRVLLSCPTRRSSDLLTALRSPTGRVLERGDALSTAVGYWGGLTCRAGVLDTANDEFVARWAEPFFRSIAMWYSLVRERSEEHTSELQSREKLVCRLL